MPNNVLWGGRGCDLKTSSSLTYHPFFISVSIRGRGGPQTRNSTSPLIRREEHGTIVNVVVVHLKKMTVKA